ncbi:MAG: Gfo/Idh/MocA family oxidoreductase [Halieaceae bacterium]
MKRRDFFSSVFGVLGGISATSVFPEEDNRFIFRHQGKQSPAIAGNVRVAVIGVGNRGKKHLLQLGMLDDTEIVGLCDLREESITSALSQLRAVSKRPVEKIHVYKEGPLDYKRMLAQSRPDAVYICTPWDWHEQMALDCLDLDINALVEIPLAVTVRGCARIVERAKRSRASCMVLENVCFGEEELTFKEIVHSGLLGEIGYAEGAYVHDLRHRLADVDSGHGSGVWRVNHWATRSGNLYPTHAVGPISKYLGCYQESGDYFQSLSSFSSPARNHREWVTRFSKPDSKLRKIDFRGGDTNITMIRTSKNRLIKLVWDESTPRPYTRTNRVQGTRGVAVGFPTRFSLDFMRGESPLPLEIYSKLSSSERTNFHKWTDEEKTEVVMRAFRPEILKVDWEKSLSLKGGHPGMDGLMNMRVIRNLREGAPLDISIEESAAWSMIAELSERSNRLGGQPVSFPNDLLS